MRPPGGDLGGDAPVRVRRALISVSDKHGLIEFGAGLCELAIEIVATGGTASALRDAGIPARDVAEVTGCSEILDGRVKTLHPTLYAAILARRGDSRHEEQLRTMGTVPIDLVAVNLYPFEATIATRAASLDEALEQIDIGGPSLIRAAAKNFQAVAVVVDPADYDDILSELRAHGRSLTRARRLQLAAKAFAYVARYDSAVATFMDRQRACQPGPFGPAVLGLQLLKVLDLRYGENPHQRAVLYRDPLAVEPSIASAKQLQGKALSFNNVLDLDAALAVVQEFDEPAAAIVKHTNPCGVAVGETTAEAYRAAKAADPTSAYGGVLGVNRAIDPDTAREVATHFLEAIVAPGYEEPARSVLGQKHGLRLLVVEPWAGHAEPPRPAFELRPVAGGLLVQERDTILTDVRRLRAVTRRAPTEPELRALGFAWTVVKHVKSNAVVLATERATVGIGAGQMSRVDACRVAAMKAGGAARGAALASDGFFPFRDGIDVAAAAGVSAIIQPGGSIRDAEVIRAADEANIAMVFTGIRQFRH